MTFASILPLLWKFKNYIGIALVVLVIGGYWLSLQHKIKNQASELNTKDSVITQLQTEKIQLQVAIHVQNANIDRMEQYARQKDAAIADATRLAESLQDEISLKAQQIMNKDTRIDGVIVTLADCQGELNRIKQYMIEAETRFKEGISK